MPDRLRCLNRDRFFAWLEFQDPRDGAAFSAGFTSMGWQNLLGGLREKKGARGQVIYEDARRSLEVRVYRSTSGKEQGALWTPDDSDDFTRRWILRPGVVSSPEPSLTADDEPGARFADLVIVSGHGSKGRVYGDALGRAAGERPPGERRWYLANLMGDRDAPRGKRLKYLIVPACTNCGPGVAPMWLDAFRDRAPDEVLHGVLGYAQAYPGDEVGAIIMRRFVDLVFPPLTGGKPPRDEKTILQCWAEANKRSGAGWGAVMLTDAARHDRMSQWLSQEGLPDPTGAEVRQYDDMSTRFPAPLGDDDGVVVSDDPPDYEARFWVSKRGDAQDNLQRVDGLVLGWDGREHIRCGNNDNFIDPQLGLDPGRVGKLVLSAKRGAFSAGTTMTVVVYLYRETHEGVSLPSLFEFHLSPSQQRRFTLLADANRRKGDVGKGRVDAFHYTFDDSDEEARAELRTGQVELLFVVPEDAPKRNPDRSTAHSCGYFWLDVVPPRALSGPLDQSPPEGMPKSGSDRAGIAAYQRTAVHLMAHGVHLHPWAPAEGTAEEAARTLEKLSAEAQQRRDVA
ncbi:MAG: hypothetical protein U0359_05560 [Byssovorax sp.]